MGSLIYFLVLAFVTLTGRVVASTHNARKRKVERGPEKVELQVFDEKAEIREALGGATSPSLPMFRIRRTLFPSGACSTLEGTLKEKQEALLTERSNLKKTLRIIIPGGEALRRRPRVSEIPPSFNFYAEQRQRGQDATSISTLATSINVPKVYTALATEKSPPIHTEATTRKASPWSYESDASSMVLSNGVDNDRIDAHSHGISRVGILKIERMDKQFRVAKSFIGD